MKRKKCPKQTKSWRVGYHIPLISHSYTTNISFITKPWFTIPLLVGGAITILKNDGVKVNGKDDIPYILWNIKMSETTSQNIIGPTSWKHFKRQLFGGCYSYLGTSTQCICAILTTCVTCTHMYNCNSEE